MKICVVSDGLPFSNGGAQLRAFRHTSYLRTVKGVDAMLLAWDRNHELHQTELPEFVIPIRLRGRLPDGPRSWLHWVVLVGHLVEITIRVAWRLFRMRHRIDVLHAINVASWFTLITARAARFLGKSVVLEMVSLGADDPLTFSKRLAEDEDQLFPHVPLKYLLFLQADAYISKSPALSSAYRKAGLPDGKLFQIASGVDTEKFRPVANSEKRRLRKELDLPEDAIVILFVGGRDRLKGFDELLAAFRQVVENEPNTYLVLAGTGGQQISSFGKHAESYIQKRELTEHVNSVGRVTHMQKHMQASDIYVHPSWREGFSMAVLEAMATGLAIVASDIREIACSQIEHGVEGLLVPVGNQNELARALSRVVADRELRMRLGHAARKRVLESFTKDKMYARYCDLYTRVLSSNLKGCERE